MKDENLEKAKQLNALLGRIIELEEGIDKDAESGVFTVTESFPTIVGVIFNPPYTIVNWSDKTKSMAKCGNDDVFSEEFGLAMALADKIMTRGEFMFLVENASRQYPKIVETDSKDNQIVATITGC